MCDIIAQSLISGGCDNLGSAQMLIRSRCHLTLSRTRDLVGGTFFPAPSPPLSLEHEFFETVTQPSRCKCFHFLPSLEVFKCVLMVILLFKMSSHLNLLIEESTSSPRNWTLPERH